MAAAARDVRPVYYERNVLDRNNESPELQAAVRDRIQWFVSMKYSGHHAGRRRVWSGNH